MNKYNWKKTILLCGLTLALIPALAACSRVTPPSTAAQAENKAQAPTEITEASTPEREISYTILLGGEKTEVFLDVNSMEIELWDKAAGGKLLATAKYPEEIQGAAEALNDCDFTDLDNDGNSDLSASFLFEDESTASLLWFFSNGGFVYNEEFSQLPGAASKGE